MLLKNMDYLTQRLRCTDAEKDACLETVVEILHLWDIIRRDGLLAVGCDRTDQEADPFFRGPVYVILVISLVHCRQLKREPLCRNG